MTVTIARAGQALQGNMDFNELTEWRELGSITVAQALLGADKSNAAVIAAIADGGGILQEIENGAVAYEWRFRTDGSEDDAPILQMYRCAGIDHFSHVVQLTLDQGTQQAAAGIFFADGITPANEAWFDDTFNIEPSVPSDNIASYGLNVYGNNQFLFIASSLVVTTIYIDARRLP